MVVMGRIAAPYGVQGWLNVQPDTVHPDGLCSYPVWWVETREGWKPFHLAEARTHGNHLVARLEGIGDRDAALRLKGTLVAIPRAELPEPDENEYYWADLVGLDVINTEGVALGKIASLLETGANDVMVVTGSREHLIPFIEPVVVEVNLAGKRMVVDWDPQF